VETELFFEDLIGFKQWVEPQAKDKGLSKGVTTISKPNYIFLDLSLTRTNL
jgi:hypothetical protein